MSKRERFEEIWWRYSIEPAKMREYFMRLHDNEFYRNLNFNGRTLDIGCGDQGSSFEKDQKDAFLVGMDISRNALKLAKKNNKDANLVCADAEHLPFVDNSFDKVLSIGVTVYADDALESLKEAKRVSKKDIILTFSHEDDTFFKAEYGYKVFNENKITKILEEGLGLKIKTPKTYTLKDLGIKSALPENTKSIMYVECEK